MIQIVSTPNVEANKMLFDEEEPEEILDEGDGEGDSD